MIRYLGMSMIFLCAFWISREYTRYQSRRLEEGEGILKLLNFVKRELICFSRPIGAWSAEFSDEALTRVGFLTVLREKEDFYAAYAASEAKLSLGEDGKALLSSFSSGFGHGYRDEEVGRISYYIDEFERLVGQERRQVPRRCRLVRTMCATVSLMLVILLL